MYGIGYRNGVDDGYGEGFDKGAGVGAGAGAVGVLALLGLGYAAKKGVSALKVRASAKRLKKLDEQEAARAADTEETAGDQPTETLPGTDEPDRTVSPE
ncbi:MAG: hypothetical protein ABI563_04120 [Specibacter sp.]